MIGGLPNRLHTHTHTPREKREEEEEEDQRGDPFLFHSRSTLSLTHSVCVWNIIKSSCTQEKPIKDHHHHCPALTSSSPLDTRTYHESVLPIFIDRKEEKKRGEKKRTEEKAVGWDYVSPCERVTANQTYTTIK